MHFSISEDNTVVKTAHRADLFPILMRYLYYLKADFFLTLGHKNSCIHIMFPSATVMEYFILYFLFVFFTGPFGIVKWV